MSHPDHSTSAGAARRRDRGLRRVKSTTRWVAAAAAAGSVVLATGYAHALPGKSSATPRGTSRPSAPAPTSTSPTPAPGSSAPAAPRTPSRSAAPSPHPTVPKQRTTYVGQRTARSGGGGGSADCGG